MVKTAESVTKVCPDDPDAPHSLRFEAFTVNIRLTDTTYFFGKLTCGFLMTNQYPVNVLFLRGINGHFPEEDLPGLTH